MNKFKTSEFLVCFSCFITMCTQMLDYYSYIRACMIISWLFTLFCYIFMKGCRIKKNRYIEIFISCYVLYFSYCIILQLFDGKHFVNSSYVKLLMIPISMYCVGMLLGRVGFELWKIVLASSVGAIIVLFYILNKLSLTISKWMEQKTNIYVAKNSASLLFMVCVIFLVFIKFPAKTRAVKIPLVVGLLFGCLFLQGRTATFGGIIALVLVWFFEDKGKNKRRKVEIGIILVICSFVVLVIERGTFLFHGLRLDSEFSMLNFSNFIGVRDIYWSRGLAEFLQNPVFGVGGNPVDNLYLCTLKNDGIIGATFVLFPWFVRLLLNYKEKNNNREDYHGRLAFCLTIFYLFESLMESVPPYGPGTSSFLFWIVCGYNDNNQLSE